MNIKQKTILLSVQACLMLIFTGCSIDSGPVGVTLKRGMPPMEITLPAIAAKETSGGQEVARRFQKTCRSLGRTAFTARAKLHTKSRKQKAKRSANRT